MDRLSLCDCLIDWIKSLNIHENTYNFDDFRDGILISKCLNFIDPNYFRDEWLSKLKTNTNDNFQSKWLNLKKVMDLVQYYYVEVLEEGMFVMPDLYLFCETNDRIVLSHILQIVLGCAVNCARKNDFIKSIMEMPDDRQHIIMEAIKDLASQKQNKLSAKMCEDEYIDKLKKAQSELNRANETKNEFELKCNLLDAQICQLQEEKVTFMNAIDLLQAKIQENEDFKNNDIERVVKLQQKYDILQDEFYKIDALREEYRIKYETTKVENDTLIETNIELKKQSFEAKLLKDEIQILQQNRHKIIRLETAIDSYKLKLDAMNDLKNQIRLLEESNTKYMEQIIQFEEEAKKIQVLKNQIEMYKKQTQDLHESVRVLEMKAKKFEYENKHLEERLIQEQSEREQLGDEIDKLRESNELLQLSLTTNANNSEVSIQSNNSTNTCVGHTDGSFNDIELINVPLELKEKIVRMYHENKSLKSQQDDLNDEKMMILHNQYDDEKARSHDLQARLDEAQLQIINLESQINDLKYSINNKSPRNGVPSEERLQQKFDHLTIEKNLIREQLNNKEKELFELQELNDKYRNYLEKAKVVITSLDPLRNNSTSGELLNLRNQLGEKDKYIRQLLKEQEKLKANHEKEEQLLMTAWQKLIVNLNEQTMDERLKSIGSSFLSQQRHLPPSSKRQMSTTSLPASNNNHK